MPLGRCTIPVKCEDPVLMPSGSHSSVLGELPCLLRGLKAAHRSSNGPLENRFACVGSSCMQLVICGDVGGMGWTTMSTLPRRLLKFPRWQTSGRTPCHSTAPSWRHLQQLAFVLWGHTPHLEHQFHAVTGADQNAPGTPHRASLCLVPCDLVRTCGSSCQAWRWVGRLADVTMAT